MYIRYTDDEHGAVVKQIFTALTEQRALVDRNEELVLQLGERDAEIKQLQAQLQEKMDEVNNARAAAGSTQTNGVSLFSGGCMNTSGKGNVGARPTTTFSPNLKLAMV